MKAIFPLSFNLFLLNTNLAEESVDFPLNTLVLFGEGTFLKDTNREVLQNCLHFIGSTRGIMSTAARKRLMRDFKRLQHDPPSGVQGSPLDNNVMIWQAVIFG